jgi:hypothetical protein
MGNVPLALAIVIDGGFASDQAGIGTVYSDERELVEDEIECRIIVVSVCNLGW